MKTLTNTFALQPNDSRKSFYGKAIVKVYSDGTQILQSYQTDVLQRNPNGTFKLLWFGWSATTGKHIRAFTGLNKKEFEVL